jgi:hypothetical protein
MRRFGAGLAALVLLLGLLPLTLSSCYITCGCASTPDPNWTPPPVSAAEAVAAAAKFAAGSTGTQPSGQDAALVYSGQDHPLYAVQGPTVGAVVDAHGGLVLEYVQIDAIPDSNDVTISSAEAEARATSFLSDRGWVTGILVATTTFRSGATSVYEVTWAAQSGGAGQISVSVNPSSGTPFAFVDERSGVQLVPPSIGATAAGRLALAAISTPGEVVLSTDFRFDLAHPYWDINLATPSATATAAPEHGASVSVDAVTGSVTVGKSY